MKIQSTCLREAASAKAGEIRISKQIRMTEGQNSKWKANYVSGI
jgi:hypothetical protein